MPPPCAPSPPPPFTNSRPPHYDADQRAAWAAPDADLDGFPFDDPAHRLVVADRDGTVVGFGQPAVTDAEVVAVYVPPTTPDAASAARSSPTSRATPAAAASTTSTAPRR